LKEKNVRQKKKPASGAAGGKKNLMPHAVVAFFK